MKLLTIVVYILAILFILSSNASASTITVCPIDCGYTSIQDAINSSNSGDMIIVLSGTYYENVNVNKQLILKGIDSGTGMPIVDASGSASAITLSADEITLKGFEATGSGLIESSDSGIKVISDYNTIENNIANNNGNFGIFLENSNNNMVYNNVGSFNSKRYGILLVNSSNNTLLINTANQNGYYGIQVTTNSNNNTLLGNIVKNNPHYGIVFAFYSKDNNVDRNELHYNGWGIHFYLANNNTLINNNITNNGGKGIWLVSSSNNKFYNNNFINSNNALCTGTNLWDYNSIGNHWSNYDEPSEGCYDNDINGICDSPYSVPGGSWDNFPLVIWSVPPPILIPAPTTVSLIFKVVDNNTGDAIADAKVQSSRYFKGITDENGIVIFEVPLGDYKYFVKNKNYRRDTGIVSVTGDQYILEKLSPKK